MKLLCATFGEMLKINTCSCARLDPLFQTTFCAGTFSINHHDTVNLNIAPPLRPPFIFPFIIIGMNIFLCFMIERIGSWQKFPKHSLFHHFVFTMFYIYFMLNLFVMPGLLSGTSSSLFEIIAFGGEANGRKIWNTHVYNSGTFFSSLIVQTSLVRMISDMLLVVPFAKARFSYGRMYRHLKSMRKNNVEKRISDVYQFGYNYSMECVMFTLIYVFGIHQPLILFSGLGYLFLRNLSATSALILVFKNQLYMKTKIYDSAISRLVFAVPMSFLVLGIKLYYYEREWYALLNFVLFLGAGFYGFNYRHKSFAFTDFLEQIETKKYLRDGLLADAQINVEERNRIDRYFSQKIVDRIMMRKMEAHGLM